MNCCSAFFRLREVAKQNFSYSAFGVHVHPTYTISETVWNRIATLGPWVAMQIWLPEWNNPKSRLRIELNIEAAHARGLRIILRIEDPGVYSAYARPEAKTDSAWFSTIYAPLVTSIINRFRGMLVGVQVYNEVENEHQGLLGPTGQRITASEMVVLVSKTRTLIKNLDESIQILPPAPAYFQESGGRSVKWAHAMLDAGMLDVIDVWPLHYYADNPFQRYELHQKFGARINEKPILIMEANGFSEQDSKRWLTLKGIVTVAQECYKNLIGTVVYCWQRIPHGAEGDKIWGIQNTRIEDWMKDAGK